MLKLVAHSGDACHLISDPATLEHKFAVPKQHYKAVGRDDLRGVRNEVTEKQTWCVYCL
jgi:hypothetical protein